MTTHAQGDIRRRGAGGSEDGVAGIEGSVSGARGAAARVVTDATCRSYMALMSG
jgi:hypothetical protein